MAMAIPILLLKTRSQPHDAYDEYFSSPAPDAGATQPAFAPQFVPVLEHTPNTRNLDALSGVLHSGNLAARYGGMIFTSQRAVEAWTDLVARGPPPPPPQPVDTSPTATAVVHSTPLVEDPVVFPLYSVGPATSRALQTLVAEASTTRSAFAALGPEVLGEHTGTGAVLATFILSHYNGLHSRRVYTFYDAPRLPFTPVLGPPRGERVERDDVRLRKKPLLFLVGEQRRDVIPTTLSRAEDGLRIDVDEVEVYATVVRAGFRADFEQRVVVASGSPVVVIVVFSGQGCDTMLRSLGYIDQDDRLTDKARRRWRSDGDEDGQQKQRYVIVTIGPTTRDHLRDKFGFDADVCAAKPSPEGIGDGLRAFFAEKKLT